MTTALMERQETAAGAPDPRSGKYLTFSLGREEFAIRVIKVREIIGLQEITSVPQTPAFVKGVINLRGKVIPVIDLRLKFGIEGQEYSARTCIIVVQITGQQESSLPTGVVVDAVSEVLTLNGTEIEPAPEFGDSAPAPYLLGLAKVKDRVKILLDIDQVLRDQDLSGLQSMMR